MPRGIAIPTLSAPFKDQADKLLHMSGTDFYYEPQIDLAERLAAVAPGRRPSVSFSPTAVRRRWRLALKLARWHTGRPRAVAFFGAFHGRTYGAMSLSGSKVVHRRGFSPLVPDIHHVPFPRGCTTCARGDGMRLRPPDRRDGLEAHRAAGRGRGHLRGTDPGRRGLPRAPARLSTGTTRFVRQAWHAVRRRRSAVRHGTHG